VLSQLNVEYVCRYLPSGNVEYVLVEMLSLYQVGMLNMGIRWEC